LEEDRVGDIYVVSHQDAADGVEGSRFYVAGAGNLYASIGRRLLRFIDDHRLIPPHSSVLPLWLFREDLLELLLGCDPDIVVIQGLRWAYQLKRLVQSFYPHWSCLTPSEAWPDVDLNWRRFDPSAKVSIVLPTYNGSKYLHQSIESCLNQTFRNIELIIVDDGSTEDMLKIVNSYTDSRIKLIRHERNRGLAEALNTGFRSSTGTYLTWTSDDNYYEETAVEELVRFLQTYPRVDFAYAESHVIDERGPDKEWRRRWVLPASSLNVGDIISPCFLYKRAVYEAIGNYEPAEFLNEDYDYWIRISKRFMMQRLFKPLYYYRRHAESLTNKYGAEKINQMARLVWQRHRKGHNSLWRRMLGLGRTRGNQELPTGV